MNIITKWITDYRRRGVQSKALRERWHASARTIAGQLVASCKAKHSAFSDPVLVTQQEHGFYHLHHSTIRNFIETEIKKLAGPAELSIVSRSPIGDDTGDFEVQATIPSLKNLRPGRR